MTKKYATDLEIRLHKIDFKAVWTHASNSTVCELLSSEETEAFDYACQEKRSPCRGIEPRSLA